MDINQRNAEKVGEIFWEDVNKELQLALRPQHYVYLQSIVEGSMLVGVDLFDDDDCGYADNESSLDVSFSDEEVRSLFEKDGAAEGEDDDEYCDADVDADVSMPPLEGEENSDLGRGNSIPEDTKRADASDDSEFVGERLHDFVQGSPEHAHIMAKASAICFRSSRRPRFFLTRTLPDKQLYLPPNKETASLCTIPTVKQDDEQLLFRPHEPEKSCNSDSDTEREEEEEKGKESEEEEREEKPKRLPTSDWCSGSSLAVDDASCEKFKANLAFKIASTALAPLEQIPWDKMIIWEGGQEQITSHMIAPLSRQNERLHRGNSRELQKDDWLSEIVWDPVQHTIEGRFKVKGISTALLLDPNDEEMLLQTDDLSSSDPPKEQQQHQQLLQQQQKLLQIHAPLSLNISKDEIYGRKTDRPLNQRLQTAGVQGGNVWVSHSTPALKIEQLFKTHLSETDYQQFHRPLLHLKDIQHISTHHLSSSLPNISQFASPNRPGSYRAPRNIRDLSAVDPDGSCDGRIVLLEYLEQHPPLIQSVGMASQIITFYRKTNTSAFSNASSYSPHGEDEYGDDGNGHSNGGCAGDEEEEEFLAASPDDGVVRFLSDDQDSPFISCLQPGQSVQAIENNLFISPIHHHPPPPPPLDLNTGIDNTIFATSNDDNPSSETQSVDFLLTRGAGGKVWHLCEMPARYTVGQIQPKVEVPTPNSRAAMIHTKNRLEHYILRYLAKHDRVQTSTIAQAFPEFPEATIRKTLREFAYNQRLEDGSSWWILNTSYDFPAEERLRSLARPEDICAYESMRTAQHRLAAAGIPFTNNAAILAARPLFSSSPELEAVCRWVNEELLLTPWNITHSFLHARQGGMKLFGLGNPLPRGQGFSFLKADRSSGKEGRDTGFDGDVGEKDKEEDGESGEDAFDEEKDDAADLRKLTMTQMEEILIEFGVRSDRIRCLKRWERVRLIQSKLFSDISAARRVFGGKLAHYGRSAFGIAQIQYEKDIERIFNNQLAFISSSYPVRFDKKDMDKDEGWNEQQTAPRAIIPASFTRKMKRWCDIKAEVKEEEIRVAAIVEEQELQDEEQEQEEEAHVEAETGCRRSLRKRRRPLTTSSSSSSSASSKRKKHRRDNSPIGGDLTPPTAPSFTPPSQVSPDPPGTTKIKVKSQVIRRRRLWQTSPDEPHQYEFIRHPKLVALFQRDRLRFESIMQQHQTESAAVAFLSKSRGQSS